MTRIRLVFCFLSLALLSCTTAFADILVGNGQWSAVPVATPASPDVYWNHQGSGGESTLLNCLAGGCGMTDSPGTNGLNYYGDGRGGATAFTFSNDGSGNTAALEIEIAGNKNYNAFGWYDTAVPTVLYELFNGTADAYATKVFTPTLSYGFYFTTLAARGRSQSFQAARRDCVTGILSK
jgi:hypothetical protein